MCISGDPDALAEKHLALAQETGTFWFNSLGRADAPGVATTEEHCWENAARFDVSAIAPFMEKLLE